MSPQGAVIRPFTPDAKSKGAYIKNETSIDLRGDNPSHRPATKVDPKREYEQTLASP